MSLLDPQEKITDFLGYFRVFKKYPQKSQIWKSETSPNQGTWLGIPRLGLVSLCQIWDFYRYSLNTLKYPRDALTKHAGSINYQSRMERTWEDKIILLLRIGLNNLYKVTNAYCKGDPIWWNGGLTDWRNVIAEYKEYSKIWNMRKILKYGIYRIF